MRSEVELDSVLVYATSEADVARLRDAGGEVWQWGGHAANGRGASLWHAALIRLPADVAVRLGLITLGGELQRERQERPHGPRRGRTARPSAITAHTRTSVQATY